MEKPYNSFALMDVMKKAFKPKGMEQSSSVSIVHDSLWVRVYDIPLAFQMEAVVKSIVLKFMKLECFECPSLLEPNIFLWFKVQFDVTKPLLRGLKIKFVDGPVWIPVKYESLPIFCFCCGVMGHQFRTCKEFDRDVGNDIDSMHFGAFLRAPTG
ncbi:hypothetical protein ACS0TY_031152 [Phlomoides rotata]